MVTQGIKCTPTNATTTHLVEVLEGPIKLRIQGDEVSLTAAEAGPPAALLGHQTIHVGDQVSPPQQVLPLAILVWQVLEVDRGLTSKPYHQPSD